ncbi:MAG: GNAT family N-acetyltransferase [Candidatus Methanogranum gryphiswaldense]|nr:MAG: GNAT family N-acetyltransferase [Candidatus Methanogranum sp. U3.2.1]
MRRNLCEKEGSNMLTAGKITKEDIPEALSISLKELGSDYLSEKDFEEALSSRNAFCIVVRDDGKVAGFAICQIFGPDMVDKMLHLPDSRERSMLMSKNRIGLFDSVSVSETSRGKGVGTVLAKTCMDRFRAEGTEAVTAMAWEDYTGHCNIRKILVNSMELTPSYAIKGYWNQFVNSPEGHHCPMCGSPCKCFGRLFYKEF